MINAIYGKKIGMTQIFDDEDRIVPVTVIQAEPNTVCQVKTVDTGRLRGRADGLRLHQAPPREQAHAGPLRRPGRRAEALPARGSRRERRRVQGGRRADRRGLRRREEGRRDRHVQGQGLRRRHEALRLRRRPGGHGAHFHRAPVPWASAPRRPACSRACACLATWAATPSP